MDKLSEIKTLMAADPRLPPTPEQVDWLIVEVERLGELEAELRLRRAQMSAFPFCPDHRDKVHGRSCRECEIERLDKRCENLRRVAYRED